MERTYDSEIVQNALSRYEDNLGVRADIWLLHDANIALLDDKDVGMFDDFAPGIYTGHYFFKSRGKDAYDTAIRMLRWMFDNHAEVIRGLTPTTHKGALSLTRKIGFKSYGEVMIEDKSYVIFIMTKNEFHERYRKD